MGTKIETSSETIAGLQGELERRGDQLALANRKGAEASELFRLLVSSVRDYAIFLLDPSGRVATWNAGAERLKGYRAEEIIGLHFSKFYPEVDIRAGKCEMELEVAAREGRFEDEGWRLKKDGTPFWANVIITALRDSNGMLVGFGKVTRDLTERKHAEELRLAAEERFRFLVESVKDYAIFILDPRGYVATWNTGAERIKGYRAEEIIGQHFSKFYPPEELYKTEFELQVAEKEGRFEDEGFRLRKDGTKFWANVLISPIRNREGTLIGFSKVTRDLTDRKAREEDRAARLAAEQANRTKDEFLAMLGHELRNPLAPIVTALQLIKLRGDMTAKKEYEVIERQVTHMMHLVDDLLDVSRVTRGKIDIKRVRLDIRAPIAKAIEIASPLMEERRHQFEVNVPPHGILVDGDEARLTQVFANLLTNAAKYTDRGGSVVLTVQQSADEVSVEVRDNGQGIEPELLAKVFEPFVQGYQTPDRAVGGLGLGLALVRSLVGLHEGRVEAHSPGRGKGSRFVVTLPSVGELAPPPPSGEAGAFAATGNRQRILLVDDNADARLLLSEVLTAVGHDVRTAGDGPEALALLETFQPDVAVLDIGLPVMDGYELADQLRAKMAKPPRLIALSGYGQPGDQEKSVAAGFEQHLVKPVDLKNLLASIGR
ncbi:MAG TPA: PAS domain S-box protein [Kofleriaceae bacterium]|nr:PAS domain S-box protein [Kofleriaceae bacterium]